MQWECVIFKDGQLQNPIPDRHLWAGGWSVAHSRGPMIQHIESCFKKYGDQKVLCVIPCTDGDLSRVHLQEYLDAYPDHKIILGTLGQSFEDLKDVIHYLYLPLDDGFFQNGVLHYFPDHDRVEWSNRIPKVYWRGGCSGENSENSARIRTVANLIDFPYADVRLNWWWAEGKNIPAHYFAGREPHTQFMKYKMNLIIDGNVIASSHMWAFASGAVPLLVSNATSWFSKFLLPFVHYIPIQYDLSDLQEKILWVINHDKEAENIAKNALEFARTYFNADFQRHYLSTEIDRFLNMKDI